MRKFRQVIRGKEEGSKEIVGEEGREGGRWLWLVRERLGEGDKGGGLGGRRGGGDARYTLVE